MPAAAKAPLASDASRLVVNVATVTRSSASSCAMVDVSLARFYNADSCSAVLDRAYFGSGKGDWASCGNGYRSTFSTIDTKS